MGYQYGSQMFVGVHPMALGPVSGVEQVFQLGIGFRLPGIGKIVIQKGGIFPVPLLAGVVVHPIQHIGKGESV